MRPFNRSRLRGNPISRATAIFMAVAGHLSAADQEAPALEFVWVAPNTGKASGGHNALRIGERVYHYQMRTGRLLMRREPWQPFDRRNRFLHNLDLRISRLDVSPADVRAIKMKFDRLYTIQERYLDRLESLEIEAEWFAFLAGEQASVSLPVLGLFEKDSLDDHDTLELKRAVAGALGDGFLPNALRRAADDVRQHALEVSRLADSPVDATVLPTGSIAAERLRERLLILESLKALHEGRALAPDILVTPRTPPLSSREKGELRQLADNLKSSFARLLASPRPDKGKPALIALARFQAVQRSLAEGRWILLSHPFTEGLNLLDKKKSIKNRDLVAAWAEQAGEKWKSVRTKFLDLYATNEKAYAHMEGIATSYHELDRAAREGRAIRAATLGPPVPTQPGPATPPRFDLPADRLASAGTTSRGQLKSFQKAMDRGYNYKLYTQNCATELVRTMQSAFPGRESAKAALGGYVAPARGLSFVPHAMSQNVRRHWRIAETREVPCYRKQLVAKAVEESGKSPGLIRMRESNTLTSKIYPGSIRDDAFLFFADGKPALRPLQGAANLGYALIHSGAGVIVLPADGGNLAWRGLTGAVYSLPELVGFSLRRGHYDLVPDDAQSPASP